MPKWSIFVFIGITIVAVAFFGNITSGALTGEDTMAPLRALMTMDVFDGNITNFFINPDWISAWGAFTFDTPLFSGDYSQYIGIFLGLLLGSLVVSIGMWAANLFRGS